MLASDIKIIRQVQDAKFNPDGTSTPQIRVDFMVGTHGPFSERIDKADFVAGKRDDIITAFANTARVAG